MARDTEQVVAGRFGGCDRLSGEKGDASDFRRPLTVLLVEDCNVPASPFFDAAYASTQFAVEISRSASSSAARAALRERDFDLIVVDFWLGSETCLPLIEDPLVTDGNMPVIIMSNLDPGEADHFGESAGPIKSLSKGSLDRASVDAVLERLCVDRAGGPALAPGGVAWCDSAASVGEISAELRTMLLALDTIHANAAVASGALSEGQVADADTLLRKAVEGASHVRRALFDLVEMLRGGEAAVAEKDIADLGIQTAEAMDRVGFDADAKGVALCLQRSQIAPLARCGPDAARQMIESLIAGVVWNARPRSAVHLGIAIDEMVELTLTYTPQREIGLAGPESRTPALFAALGDLQVQAEKYGGTVEVEPRGGRLAAVLSLPAFRPLPAESTRTGMTSSWALTA